MATEGIREIKFDQASGLCTVNLSNGRVLRSTALSVGLALVQDVLPASSDVEVPGASASERGIEWDDMLQSHGVAIGRRQGSKVIIGLLPEVPRTVTNVVSARKFTATFPPMLMTMLLHGATYQRGQLFVYQHAKRGEIAIGSAAPCLAPFTYGNVYSDTGLICWGHVSTSGVRTLKQADELFFGSEFNADLVRSGRWWEAANNSEIALQPPPAEHYNRSLSTAISYLLRQA